MVNSSLTSNLKSKTDSLSAHKTLYSESSIFRFKDLSTIEVSLLLKCESSDGFISSLDSLIVV